MFCQTLKRQLVGCGLSGVASWIIAWQVSLRIIKVTAITRGRIIMSQIFLMGGLWGLSNLKYSCLSSKDNILLHGSKYIANIIGLVIGHEKLGNNLQCWTKRHLMHTINSNSRSLDSAWELWEDTLEVSWFHWSSMSEQRSEAAKTQGSKTTPQQFPRASH